MGTHRRVLLATAVAALALGGCASLNTTMSVDLSTFGEWPQGRSAGSYAFERLPSQQSPAEAAARQQVLEGAAAAALAKAGFTPAQPGQTPVYLVQVAGQLNRTVGALWEDPLWWNGSFGWRSGRPWVGPYWGVHMRLPPSSYERRAALLIRDRETGKPLFEAKVVDVNAAPSDAREIQGLFMAAMMDFPRTGINPRRVTVPLAAP
jgi:Domain of unknown function (DUF4136)